MKISILGVGAYGIALAKVFYKNDNKVCMWSKFKEEIESVSLNRESKRVLQVAMDLGLTNNEYPIKNIIAEVSIPSISGKSELLFFSLINLVSISPNSLVKVFCTLSWV